MARSASRPSTVVSTRMARRASPDGFSANSVILPVASIFMTPNADALFSVQGRAATVMSAPAARWEHADGLDAARRAFEGNVDYYLDVVLSVATDYPASVVEGQAEVLKRDLESKRITGLTRRVDPFVRHVERLRAGRPIDRAGLLAEID